MSTDSNRDLTQEYAEEQKRDMVIELSDANRGMDKDNRTVEFSFSSTTPVPRWDMEEVLVHSKESVKLKRLNDGAPLLVNHDRNDVVGVVEKAWLDGDKCRCRVRFGKSARAEEIYQDVLDGIRRNVSVAYRIIAHEIRKRKDKPDQALIKEWEPNEITLASIPADQSVGIGRSQHQKIATQQTEEKTMTGTATDAPAEQKREADATKTSPTVSTDTKVEKVEVARDLTADEKTAMRDSIRTEERKRSEAIRELAGQHDKVKGMDDLAREAISDGKTVDEFRALAWDKIGEHDAAIRSNEKVAPDVDLSRKEVENFSICRLLNAMASRNATGAEAKQAREAAGHELEVCDAAAGQMGEDFIVRGAMIPDSAMQSGHLGLVGPEAQRANFVVGTAAAAGNLVETKLDAGSFIPVLRNRSALMRAGVMMMSGLIGNVDIPRQITSGGANWGAAEDASAPDGTATFDLVQLRPHDMGVHNAASRRMIQQGTPGIEMLLRDDMSKQVALGIDRSGLHGSGLPAATPGSGGEPRGVFNQTGVNLTDFVGLQPTYRELVNMKKNTMAGNTFMESMSWIFESEIWEHLMTTLKEANDTASTYILTEMTNTVLGHQYNSTEQVDDNRMFFGDWSQLVCGEWGGYDVYIDPYTGSRQGKINLTVWKTLDWAVRYPRAFSIGWQATP